MGRRKVTGSTHKAKAPARLSSLLGCFILQPLSFLLCSCAGDNHTAAPVDPLLGTTGAPPAGQAAAPSKAPAATGTLPPLPPPTSLTSNAALTAGGPRPLEGGHELRIGTTTGSTGGAWAGQGSQVGTVPGRADGVAQPVARGASPQATGLLLSGSGARQESFEQLQAELVARGITWQRFECVDGEWHFSCSVPSRQNPNLSHTYEARSRDPQGLAAIRAALDQIEKDQQGVGR
jgi:hypothetical protein